MVCCITAPCCEQQTKPAWKGVERKAQRACLRLLLHFGTRNPFVWLLFATLPSIGRSLKKDVLLKFAALYYLTSGISSGIFPFHSYTKERHNQACVFAADMWYSAVALLYKPGITLTGEVRNGTLFQPGVELGQYKQAKQLWAIQQRFCPIICRSVGIHFVKLLIIWGLDMSRGVLFICCY